MRKRLGAESWTILVGLLSLWLVGAASPCGAEVSAGETLTIDTVAQAETLLTPSTRWMLEQSMPMRIIATRRVTWPTAYEEATEKFASQVSLSDDGRQLLNYVAGCPFPSIDLNDPLAGLPRNSPARSACPTTDGSCSTMWPAAPFRPLTSTILWPAFGSCGTRNIRRSASTTSAPTRQPRR